ncbi:MAG: mechanosensitive ion channel family protein [Methylacidiphilales bacterium]|nr:mechanosensitive ion channel family protein [Candidatus Methylacidiphilales bacterium]
MFQGLVALALVAALLHVFGIDFTTALAALGIGGLAIALGAQKFFENLIGSLTLILDQPVRVGDFCRFGTALGTVEDIGMRSTRIRTLDRTVLTVPNGEFSALHIENFSRRDRFWFHPTLSVRYDTDPEQMRFLLQELRAMLYAHPRVDPDPARVRFIRLGAFSLDIEIFAYVYAVNMDDYLEVQEDLLLRCMEIVAKSGSGFAFPSQTLYVARDSGRDGEKATAARDSVKQWQEAGELQVPRFHPDRIRELRNTIDYPPPGAAVR